MRDSADGLGRERRRRKIAVAVGLWLGMFLWSNIPPFRGNILDEKSGFFVWHWHLYTIAGDKICDVRYYDMNQDMDRGGKPIERWTLLGYETPRDMPDGVARTHKNGLFGEYRRVCSALRKAGDRDPHVEVEARCSDKTKWKRVERRRRNVCEIGVTRKRPRPPTQRGGGR